MNIRFNTPPPPPPAIGHIVEPDWPYGAACR